MKRNRMLAGLLVLLFLIFATSLLFASVPEYYQGRGQEGWEESGPAILPEAIADITDVMGKKGMKEIEITANGFGFNCGYMVMLRNGKGDMRLAEGRDGNSFVTDWNGEGSFVIHVDSKTLDEWRFVDIYSQPGCIAASGNRLEKVASLEIK